MGVGIGQQPCVGIEADGTTDLVEDIQAQRSIISAGATNPVDPLRGPVKHSGTSHYSTVAARLACGLDHPHVAT